MFNFMKKKENNSICSPVNGKCLDITECSDATFSKKMMGDGFMIDPKDDYICAPCDGKLTMVFPTKHAFGITMNNGDEILVHIGLETVNLSGKGFELLGKVNKKVKQGDKIIWCDFKSLKEQGYEVPVIVIMTGKSDIYKMNIGKEVNVGDIIVTP